MRPSHPRLALAAFVLLACSLALFLVWPADSSPILLELRHLASDSQRLRAAILSEGAWAPAIFVGLQVVQVILFPLPGEASGFLGGYLFGTWVGFLYSTLGLTLGSWLAFGISSLFRQAMLPRLYPTRLYQRFNRLVYKGDFLIPLLLFLIPGFPKDSLCYLLGLSLMPWRVFLAIAAVGRLPGTLMLSLQGAQTAQGNLPMLFLLLLTSAAIGLPFYLWRHKILSWLTRLGSKPAAGNPVGGQK